MHLHGGDVSAPSLLVHLKQLLHHSLLQPKPTHVDSVRGGHESNLGISRDLGGGEFLISTLKDPV